MKYEVNIFLFVHIPVSSKQQKKATTVSVDDERSWHRQLQHSDSLIKYHVAVHRTHTHLKYMFTLFLSVEDSSSSRYRP